MDDEKIQISVKEYIEKHAPKGQPKKEIQIKTKTPDETKENPKEEIKIHTKTPEPLNRNEELEFTGSMKTYHNSEAYFFGEPEHTFPVAIDGEILDWLVRDKIEFSIADIEDIKINNGRFQIFLQKYKAYKDRPKEL